MRVLKEGTVTRTGGVELPYVVAAGDAPAGPGKRIVFAHSLLASGVAGAPVFESLYDAGWTVLSMDQRGHGDASPVTAVEGFALEAMGADLLAMMDDAGWERAWLGGGSLGAATSLTAASLAPDRVEGMALLAPAIGRERSEARSAFTTIGEAFATGGTEAGVDAWRRRFLPPGGDPATIAHHIEVLRSGKPDVLAALLTALAGWTMGPAIDAVADLDGPVLVLAWTDDDLHPWSVAEEIASLARRGRLERIAPSEGPLGMFATLTSLLEEAVGSAPA